MAAFLYVAFYSVVDAVAGIGAGTLVRHGMEAGAGHGMHVAARDPLLQSLFDVGNGVGRYGAWAFLLGSVLLAVVGLRRWGARALPGGLILIVGAYAFTGAHIYWPVGVLSMLTIALGFGLLTVSGPRTLQVGSRSGFLSGPPADLRTDFAPSGTIPARGWAVRSRRS